MAFPGCSRETHMRQGNLVKAFPKAVCSRMEATLSLPEEISNTLALSWGLEYTYTHAVHLTQGTT